MKLLFFSPHTLLDSSSGAALCVGTLLSELVKLGHTCVAVTGSVTDARNQLFENALKLEPVASATLAPGEKLPIRRIDFKGVRHIVMSFAGTHADELRAVEEIGLRTVFLDSFKQFNPDAVLTFGGYVSNYLALQHAEAHGRRGIMYVASDSYLRPDPHRFIGTSLIHTVSDAMRKSLDALTDIPKLVTQTFVDRTDVVAATRTPEYITFVNPLPEKGLNIAAAIVRACKRLNRPYKFLFMEGRGTRDTVYALHPDMREMGNLFFGENVSDPRQIYSRTSVCLYPSVYFEPAGRIAIESNANGIPVLACNSGGIAQMLNGAGFLFDTAVSETDVTAWVETLDRLHAEPAFMADAVARANAADARYDTRAMAQRFAAAVTTAT